MTQGTKTGAGVVIAGAGHGAGQAAASLRQFGYKGSVTLIGEEPYPPYQRPPLSKAWLAGEQTLDEVLFKAQEFWQAQDIQIIPGRKVTGLDRAAKTVFCDNRQSLPYAHLVIATGGRARTLPCPGASLDGIHVLRTLDDATALSAQMQAGHRLVIIGGGYIGLEVAASARKRGLEVCILEAENRVLSRVAGKEISKYFQQLHAKRGVEIKPGVFAEAFEGEGSVSSVRLSSGEVLPADLVLVGIGLIANEELACEAGLACDNGILVDEFCRTKDRAIFAIGDVTRHPSAIYGRNVRLESVHNALEQAKTAAMAITGRDKPYNQTPWFWSDQYDIKLQIAGLSQGFDQTLLRGEPDENSFAVFYFRRGALIACDAVNAPAEYMAARMMIARGTTPDTRALCDLAVPMKELMARAQ